MRRCPWSCLATFPRPHPRSCWVRSSATGFLASCADADASCALPDPGVGYVVVHTSEGDLIVTLTVDAEGNVTASDPEPLPSVAPSPSPAG